MSEAYNAGFKDGVTAGYKLAVDDMKLDKKPQIMKKYEEDCSSLLARHNALMDAVATARKQIQMICHELQKTIGGVNVPLLMEDLVEVDRLLLEEK